MGWISDRKMKTGHGLNSRKFEKSAKFSAPLRKIVEHIRPAMSLFEEGRVLLECGHETGSNGTYRARCLKCKKDGFA